jgi:protein-L-isoaspartate(D-aspartate) O-methyltransferase
VEFEAARTKLVALLSTDISDRRVLAAMGSVPRELFVPAASRHLAYADTPLTIGYGQTISQPYIVALMSEALELKGNERVLEVGTGSGYQTAILARLAGDVTTVERIPVLADGARRLLASLGVTNVRVHQAEAALGWRQEAPYDAIMVTASAPAVPAELVGQLRTGGRMVIPVGPRHVQELCLVKKGCKKNLIRSLDSCYFVPLIGPGAWAEEQSKED